MKPLNNSDARTSGSVSGCVVWILVFALFSTCLLPVSIIASVFTTDTPIYVSILGPMFCKNDTKAIIKTEQTTMRNSNGIEEPALGASMVCVNSAGKIISEPAPLPTWTWNGLGLLAGLVIAALLALLFAAPLGVLVTRLLRRK
jgi:hypothetical protein